jgi:hypothetical protein
MCLTLLSLAFEEGVFGGLEETGLYLFSVKARELKVEGSH